MVAADLPSRPWILGIAASHNGAVCLLRGSELVVAIQEERLTREKRAILDPAAPFLALDVALASASIALEDVALAVLCPLHGPAPAPWLEQRLAAAGVPLTTISHHYAHAISAYATSGFSDAVVVVADGLGSPVEALTDAERATLLPGATGRETASIYAASLTGGLTPLEKNAAELPLQRGVETEPWQPQMMGWCSLGTMYQSVAQQIFGHWSSAGKVMGLAPHGAAAIPTSEFLVGAGMGRGVATGAGEGRFVFSQAAASRFRTSARWPDNASAYADLAASVQGALEQGWLQLAARAQVLGGSANLCLAGGVALNSVANERLLREPGLEFANVHIVPAAEDSGTAIGAAYHGLWSLTGTPTTRAITSDSLGPVYSATALDGAVDLALKRHESLTVSAPDDIYAATAERLACGDVVAWFQGGSEFGPRALGHRSILLDPRLPNGQALLNERVKHREAFRPFAPAVLEEHAAAWFDLGPVSTSRFMLRVCPVRSERRNQIPAVVHVDGTARVQTVASGSGPFRALLEAFHARTGIPLLVNTSFNVAGEPIVETPEDALACLVTTGIDCLALGHLLVVKRSDASG